MRVVEGTTRLEDMCEQVIDCPHFTPDWTDSGHIVLRNQNIKDGRLDLSAPSFTHKEDFDRRNRRAKPRAGDIVFTREAPMGEVCQIPEGLECCLGQRQVLLRPGHDVSSRYLFYAMQSPAVRNQIFWNEGTGSTVSNVRIPILKDLRIPRNDCEEAIAATLGALDDKIELNRKMNATLEAMARALFRDWFVDFGPTRAKMEGAAPYLAPDLWSLFPNHLDAEGKPEGWAYEPLLDQAEWVNGAAYKNMHFSDAPGALPVIKIAELKNGVTGNTQWTATDLGARYLIDDGELLFSWSGNPDTSIDTFLWTGGKAWLNQHIFAVRPNGKRPKPYLHALLKYLKPEFAELARNKQTTGLGHVTKADMQRMMVCAASPEVHKAFDRLIEPIFNQAVGLQMETRTLCQTRDLLLPRLISGELRVGDLASFDQEAVA